jgi:DNA replication protein DnaC
MALSDILARAKQYKPAFSTPEEYLQWQAEEARKDSIKINQQNLKTRANKLTGSANIGKKHACCTFDNYQLCENSSLQKGALEVCRYYAESFAAQHGLARGMVLYGSTGTGKNHLATAIVNHVLNDGYSTSIIKVSDLMGKFRQAYGRENGLTEDKLFKQLQQLDLLVIDEVGLSHNSVDERVQLNRVIDNRVLAVKPTIVISNLDVDGLKQTLGAAIFDRLTENDAPVLQFSWQSFRQRRDG